MVMETYYRKRYKKSIYEMEQQAKQGTAAQSPLLGRHHHAPPPPPHDNTFLIREPAYNMDKSSVQERIKLGNLYEIDYIHLPPRTPVQLKSIRVVMVCEKTELSVAVRFPSMESLRAFFSYSRRETHPALDEKFVMGSALAARVLVRLVPMEVFSEQKRLEGFWIISSSRTLGSFKEDNSGALTTHEKGNCLSMLKCSGMVRWGIRRQVKYLHRHRDSGIISGVEDGIENVKIGPKDFVGDKKEPEKGKENGDDGVDGVNDGGDDVKGQENEVTGEGDEGEDEETEDDEEEEEEYEGKKITATNNKNLKRKRYAFRHMNVKKPKKEKIEKKKQKPEKKKKAQAQKSMSIVRFKEAQILKNPKDRWSAERYKLAEQNLWEVMKSKGATIDKPILRPQLRLEARKKIGDTGLLDHLLKHMAGKLAPSGQDRFRRRHNADGAMEYWLEEPDLVNIRRDAGVTDPYWVPPPGWKPGDSPTQDPTCARELRLLKDDISKIKRDHVELMATRMQLEEEVGKLRRELDELASIKRQEENQAIIATSDHCGMICSQRLDQLAISLVSSKSGLDKEKCKEQLMMISDLMKEMEAKLVGMLTSKFEEKGATATDSALMVATVQPTSDKEKKQVAEEQQSKQQVLTLMAATAGDQKDVNKSHNEQKAAKIQRLKSGFRICKPQGTFLWPNMVKNSSSSTYSSNVMSPHQVVVQVEVPTPPSVSSSTASAPPQLPQHRHPASPVKPLAERRAVTVTVSNYEGGGGGGAKNYSTATTPLIKLSNTPASPNLIPLNASLGHGPSWAVMGYGPFMQHHNASSCCSTSSSSASSLTSTSEGEN